MPNCSNIWHDPAIRTIALTVVDLVTIRVYTNTEYLSAFSPLVTVVMWPLESKLNLNQSQLLVDVDSTNLTVLLQVVKYKL